MVKVTAITHRLLDICLAAAAVLLVCTIVRYAQSSSTPPLLKPGAKLAALSGAPSPQGTRHLVVAISTTCRFCSEEAPFYRTLVQATADRKDVAITFVLPQAPEESHRYLNQRGIAARDVRQIDANSLGIPGTPALILTDSQWRVQQSWMGALQPEQKRRVLEGIGGLQ
jgi:hypothetical protein